MTKLTDTTQPCPMAGATPFEEAALVIPLAAVTADQYPLVGGKAARLAELIQLGLPVPSGFCVTTTAFRLFLGSSPSGAELAAFLAPATFSIGSELVARLELIRAQLARAPIPPAVIEAVVRAATPMNDGCALAVRSSATIEDAPQHSFAGQFESILNVRGTDALLAAVRRCWLSLFSERALAYQSRRSLHPGTASMAVLVQAMVPADVAGVLFTVDPVDGNPERFIIEATAGLGDQLVSGRTRPQNFAIDAATSQLSPASPPLERPLLDLATLEQLGQLGRHVHRQFGGPHDIEWAVADGRIFLLQARPVTTALSKEPIRDLRDGPAQDRCGPPTRREPPGRDGEPDESAVEPRTEAWAARQVWSNINAGEVAPDVMTPITWSLIQRFIKELARPVFRMLGADGSRAPSVGLIAGRIYFNVNTGLAAVRPFARLIWAIPNVTRALGGVQFGLDNPGTPKVPVEDLPNLGFRWTKYLLSLPRVMLDWIRHSPRRGDAWTAELRARGEALRHAEPGGCSAAELADRFDHLLRGGFHGWDLLYLVTQAAALPCFQWACHHWLDDPGLDLGYRLFQGLGGVPEVEASLALWSLAQKAHADSETEGVLLAPGDWASTRARIESTERGRRWLAAWNRFLDDHGHHCRGELELFNARWSERPDYLLGVVRSYLRGLDQGNPLEKQRRLEAERLKLEASCRQRLRNPLQRWIFSRSLRRAQKLAVNRENWKNEAVHHIARLRWVLLQLGEVLARAGTLERPDDVFFLEVTELKPVAHGAPQFNVRTTVVSRRAEYEGYLRLQPPPVVVGDFNARTPPAPFTSPQSDIETLTGIPVFPGVVRGRARVIQRADDHAQVLSGEILIAPFTDPAWTPYFLPAAGVVMDLGGILSHGSIIAREFGLPAVTNVGAATARIRTGDWVEVDGRRGQVTLISRAAEGSPGSALG